MPKYRKLWTKVVESHDVNEMPDDFTRLLWVLLPLGLDSQGRGQDNMAWIKAKIMPLREDVTHEQIAQAMDWYAKRGMIERYEAGGRRYFWIPTFARYQGNTEREAASEYPPPPSQSNSGVTLELLQSNSGVTSDQPQIDSGVTPDQLRSYSASQGDAYTQGDSYTERDAEGDSCSHSRCSHSRASHLDPVEHMLTARAEMRAGVADPSQDAARWLRYRDDALRAYENATGLRALPAHRDAIVALAAEPGFDLERWRRSITTCIQNGVRPSNVSCMIDTYRAGGDYQKMQQWRVRNNGDHQRRVETTTNPQPDLETVNRIRAANGYAPLTQEQYDALE